MSDEKYVQQTKTYEQRLGHLVEELGEALSAAGKLLRWGPDSTNPELRPGDPTYGETNQQWLERELDDVAEAIDRFLSAPPVSRIRGEKA